MKIGRLAAWGSVASVVVVGAALFLFPAVAPGTASASAAVTVLDDPVAHLYSEAVTLGCPGLDWRIPAAVSQVDASRPGHDVGLTAPQEVFSEDVSAGTGLDLGVIRAQAMIEGNKGNPGQPIGNILWEGCAAPGATGCVELDGRKWAEFPGPHEGAASTVANYKTKLYASVLATAGKPPLEQIAAIAVSPWDVGHYGGPGGPHLVDAYSRIRKATDKADSLVADLCAAGAVADPAAAVLAHVKDPAVVSKVMAVSAAMEVAP